MSDSSSTTGSESEEQLQRLVDEFGARLRAGERPGIEEYVARLPQKADDLRELLTTVALLETAEPAANTALAGGLAVTHIGEFEIERELGRGGMGVVFLAHQKSLGRRVALKILPLQATLDPRFLRRFQREAKAAASLQHAHIVPVYGVGEHEGLHYYAMQFIEGQALDRVVRCLHGTTGRALDAVRAPGSVESLAAALIERVFDSGSDDGSDGGSPPNDMAGAPAQARPAPGTSNYNRNVARIGVQVADALAYAHGRGVLHRDIKPSNLLMDARGRVWVADFGLCKTADTEGLTGTADFVGTVAYMAPEQIEGRSDVRSDVYGLGVTLYELLTLRPAFVSNHRAGLLRRVADSNPARPGKLVRDLPSDLEAIVLKAMAKLPEERYGTCEALAKDLRLFLAGRPVGARPPNALRLLRLIVRRNRVLAGTVFAALAVLALVTTLYVVGLQRARDEQDRNLYQASVAAAAAASTFPDTARKLLERAPEDLRRWEWTHLHSALDDSLQTWGGVREELRVLEVTPDGSRVLFGGGAHLVVRELADAGREWVLPGHLVLEDIAVRPDGLQAISIGQRSMLLWSLEGEPVELTSVPALTGGTSAVTYDVTGERIFLGTRSGQVVCMDAALEHELFRLPAGQGSWIVDLTISPDGNLLVSASADGRIQIWDLEGQRGRWLLGHELRALSVAFSPDGSLLASSGSDGSVRLWDVATGAQLALWRDHTDQVRRVLFSPDGRWLASGSYDRTLRIWDVARRKPLRALHGHDFKVLGLAWLPDGRLLSGAFAGTIKSWDPQVTGGRQLLLGHIADLWSLSFDDSSERLVSTSRDGTVRVWDAETGQQLRVFVHSMPEWAVFTGAGASVLAGYKSGEVLEWDLASGETVWRFDPPEAEGRIEVRLAFDPRLERFYSSTHGFGVESWQRAGSGWARVHGRPLPQAGMIAVSPLGDYLAIGTWQGSCYLFDTRDLSPGFVVHDLGDSLLRVSFSPDGHVLATGDSRGNVDLWSVPGGEHLRQFRVEPPGGPFTSQVWSLAFSPDGSRLACATESLGISLWDLERGQPVVRLQGPGDGYVSVVFSPNGRSLASPAWNGVIRVWDTIGVSERRALLQAAPLDAIAVEQARAGSFEGLQARTLQLLRSPERSDAEVVQAYRLARGLYKENYMDARALETLGEAQLRRGELAEARANLAAAVQLRDHSVQPDAGTLAVLAITQARQGDAAAARASLAAALALGEPRPAGLEGLLEEARSVLAPPGDG